MGDTHIDEDGNMVTWLPDNCSDEFADMYRTSPDQILVRPVSRTDNISGRKIHIRFIVDKKFGYRTIEMGLVIPKVRMTRNTHRYPIEMEIPPFTKTRMNPNTGFRIRKKIISYSMDIVFFPSSHSPLGCLVSGRTWHILPTKEPSYCEWIQYYFFDKQEHKKKYGLVLDEIQYGAPTVSRLQGGPLYREALQDYNRFM